MAQFPYLLLTAECEEMRVAKLHPVQEQVFIWQEEFEIDLEGCVEALQLELVRTKPFKKGRIT
jgi:hypothetical protein